MPEIIFSTNFPNLLKEFRQNKGLTQLQVAHMLGVTPATICYWEQGKKTKNIRYHHMLKILQLLHSPSASETSSPSTLAPAHSDLDPPVSPMEVVPTTKG